MRGGPGGMQRNPPAARAEPSPMVPLRTASATQTNLTTRNHYDPALRVTTR